MQLLPAGLGQKDRVRCSRRRSRSHLPGLEDAPAGLVQVGCRQIRRKHNFTRVLKGVAGRSGKLAVLTARGTAHETWATACCSSYVTCLQS